MPARTGPGWWSARLPARSQARALLHAAILAVAGGLSVPSLAEAPYGLALPIDCVPGTDCWVVQHVDHDPGPTARDYRCGRLATDGHEGTDFALPDLAVMTEGVEVRAAAAGAVAALRDGMPDVSVVEAGAETVAGRECGNGVLLEHGDGWVTQYCHLRRGSLRVAEGDRVEAGHPLGLVGLSGDSSVPHVHFELRRGDRIVDPFAGVQGGPRCAAGERPFWSPEALRALGYRPLVLVGAGFATTSPEALDIRRGWHKAERLPTTSPALVLWTDGYWVEAGDRVHFRIEGPDGAALVDRTTAIEDDHRTWFGFAGAPRPEPGWPSGVYRGRVTLERGDTAVRQRLVLEREVVLR